LDCHGDRLPAGAAFLRADPSLGGGASRNRRSLSRLHLRFRLAASPRARGPVEGARPGAALGDRMTSAETASSGKTHRDENFPGASCLIAPRQRPLILAFYRFVRTADDVADHAILPADSKLALLDRLEHSLLGSEDSEPTGVALRAALAERQLPPRHALD